MDARAYLWFLAEKHEKRKSGSAARGSAPLHVDARGGTRMHVDARGGTCMHEGTWLLLREVVIFGQKTLETKIRVGRV